MNILEACGDWIERHMLIRRLVLAWSVGMTTWAMGWAFGFAAEHPDPGSAAVIGAVLAPLGLLQGWVLQVYSAARRNP